MKILLKKLAFFTFSIACFSACNNNQGKGNDTTGAGTEQHDDVNAPSENRTPAPSITADSTGAASPSIENPASGSDTTTTTSQSRKQ